MPIILPMKPKSKIEKGKRFEKLLAHRIEKAGLGMARREGGSGSGKRKGDIAANLPFLIEAKNRKAYSWWESIDQAKSQAEIGNYDSNKWALVVRDPRSPEGNPEIYAMIEFDEFLELLKKDAEPLVKAPDRNLKWDLERLKQVCQKVIRQI